MLRKLSPKGQNSSNETAFAMTILFGEKVFADVKDDRIVRRRRPIAYGAPMA